MASFAHWWEAARPKTLLASVSPVIIGSAFAQHAHSLRPTAALLCLGFAVTAQVAANFANDYFDGVRGTDGKDRKGPTRAVASGRIRAQTMRLATYAALALSACMGLGLLCFGGWGLILLGILCMLGVLGYSRASYAGLGDILVIAFFGFAAVAGTFYVQAGIPSWPVWAGAFTAGLLCDNILLVNNYRDRATDLAAGKRTLVVRLGPAFARAQYASAVLLACLGLPLLLWTSGANITAWICLPALLLPKGVLLCRALGARQNFSGLNPLLADTARFLCIWSLLLGIGLCVG